MGGLPARRFASIALCAAFLAGVSSPAAMADDSAREHGRAAAARTPLPDPEVLLAQVKNLAHIDGRLAPVRDLVTAVLTSGNGELSAADAQKLGDAAKDALAGMTSTVSAASAAVVVPAVPAVPFVAAPRFPAAGVGVLLRPAAQRRATDPTSDAVAAVQKALDDLLNAVTSGDVGQVLPAVTGLVADLIDLVTATLQDGGGSALPSGATASAPTLPALTVPALTVPGETVPGVTVPGITLPGMPAPGMTVPGLTSSALTSSDLALFGAAATATTGTAAAAAGAPAS
jgi:hypothetical protein